MVFIYLIGQIKVFFFHTSYCKLICFVTLLVLSTDYSGQAKKEQLYHFSCYFISLYDVKPSFHDFTFIVAAILDFSAAILTIDQF